MRITVALTLLILQICPAQDHWNLEDCIDYALTNKISLKQSELNIQLTENKKLQSKFQILPSINANSSFNQNQGRYIDPFSNTFIENIKRSLSWHFGFSREWLRRNTKMSKRNFFIREPFINQIYKLATK